MIKVIVPATSANLGVGYDCLGLALDEYATVYFEEIATGSVSYTHLDVECDENRKIATEEA